jgi:hypothetical protein
MGEVMLLETRQWRQAPQAGTCVATPVEGAIFMTIWRALIVSAGALFLVTALSTFAWGQDAQEDVRRTCRTDYLAKCTGNDPPYDIMVACLNQYFLSLSAGCQEALHNAPQSTPGVGGYAGGRSRVTPPEASGVPTNEVIRR